jgi:hypothetical protein
MADIFLVVSGHRGYGLLISLMENNQKIMKYIKHQAKIYNDYTPLATAFLMLRYDNFIS